MQNQPIPKKKFGWVKWVLGVPVSLFLLLIVIGLFAPKTQTSDSKASESAEEVEVGYSITSEDEYPSSSKVNVTAEINQPVNEEELKSIGNKIRSEIDDSFERVYVAYQLPKIVSGTAYAVTNFEGDELKMVHFNGTTRDQIKKLKAYPMTDGKVVGDWIETSFIGQRVTIYEKGGQFYMRRIFKDGSGKAESEKLRRISSNGAVRFSYPNEAGEYCEVLPDNVLGFFNKEGNRFATCIKI